MSNLREYGYPVLVVLLAGFCLYLWHRPPEVTVVERIVVQEVVKEVEVVREVEKKRDVKKRVVRVETKKPDGTVVTETQIDTASTDSSKTREKARATESATTETRERSTLGVPAGEGRRLSQYSVDVSLRPAQMLGQGWLGVRPDLTVGARLGDLPAFVTVGFDSGTGYGALSFHLGTRVVF